jgi:hypothetical protein
MTGIDPPPATVALIAKAMPNIFCNRAQRDRAERLQGRSPGKIFREDPIPSQEFDTGLRLRNAVTANGRTPKACCS